jgi:hypothetical protein
LFFKKRGRETQVAVTTMDLGIPPKRPTDSLKNG